MRLVENDPAWWQNPSGLLTQLDLRQVMGRQDPEQASGAWLDRNKGFAGQNLAWLMAYRVEDEMDARMAKKQHMRREEAVEKQKERIDKARSRRGRRGRGSTDPSEAVRDAEAKLAKLQAEERLWVRIADTGGAIVEAIYMPKAAMESPAMGRRSMRRGRGARRRGRSAGPSISVQLAVTTDQLNKLFDYEDDLQSKYMPISGGRWPIVITGSVDYFAYDGSTVSLIVDGSWQEVPAGTVKLPDRMRGMPGMDDDDIMIPPRRRGRGSGRGRGRGRGRNRDRGRGRGRERRMDPEE